MRQANISKKSNYLSTSLLQIIHNLLVNAEKVGHYIFLQNMNVTLYTYQTVTFSWYSPSSVMVPAVCSVLSTYN